MVVQVVTDGQISHDPEDILSVIEDGHRVMGVGHMDNDQKSGSNDGLFYITIYNDQNTPTPLQFEFFDASTGNIHIVEKECISSPETTQGRNGRSTSRFTEHTSRTCPFS